MTSHDHLLKFVITGDTTVGKTCMLSRFTDDYFNDTYISTIGVDFKIRIMEVDGVIVKLQLWDTAGQERFRVIINSYYRNAAIVFIVFDLGSRASFQNVPFWYEEAKRYTLNGTKIFLVGCKSDLKWEVDKNEIAAMADQYGIQWCHCSAKNNIGINDIFNRVIRESLMHRWTEPCGKESILPMDRQIEENNGCCTIL